jgi:hypothetical protein
MTRSAIVRFRALGLLAAVLVVAAGALWIGSSHGDVAAVQHPGGLVLADPDQAAVVSPTAEARSTSGWIMPLAALGAAVTIAFRFFARRDPRSVRASFAVKQRLVRACRRAPPRLVVTPLF